MSRAPRKPPLALDMDFSEALTRFAKVDPNELPEELRPRRFKPKPKEDEPNPT